MIEQDYRMDAAMGEADSWASLPWCAPVPGEGIDEPEEEDGVFGVLAQFQELVLTFAFSDGNARRWEAVALRLIAAMRVLAPSVLVGRDLAEVKELAAAVPDLGKAWGVSELRDLSEDLVQGMAAARLFEWWFPREKREWVKKGTKRVYLIARAFQPQLPGGLHEKRDHRGFLERDFSYTELAAIFGDEGPRSRARARWSALAKRVIREPIEKQGMICSLNFGKKAETRERYREAAMGNCNRRKSAS